MSLVETIIQQLLNGLILGSFYGLVALGYTMVYGIIKLLNFAHGDLYMVGGFIGFAILSMLSSVLGNGWIAIMPVMLLTMIIVGFLGVLIHRLPTSPCSKHPDYLF